MLELKWIPVHDLTREEIKRQKALHRYCMNRHPKIIERLIRDHGPFPLLWDFNVPAVIQRLEDASQGSSKVRALRVSRKENPMGLRSREDIRAAIETRHQPVAGPCPPAHFEPRSILGGVAVLPRIHEGPAIYTGPPLPWAQPGPPARWMTPAAPPPPLYDGCVVDHRPSTRQSLDDVHFPAVRGRTPNPFGAIGEALPTRRNP